MFVRDFPAPSSACIQIKVVVLNPKNVMSSLSFLFNAKNIWLAFNIQKRIKNRDKNKERKKKEGWKKEKKVN